MTWKREPQRPKKPHKKVGKNIAFFPPHLNDVFNEVLFELLRNPKDYF